MSISARVTRIATPLAVLAALGLAAALALAAPPTGAPAAGAPLRVSSVSFIIGHRVFTDFSEKVAVKMHESFRVGDTEYTAKVVEFQPDFTMDLKSHKIHSRSQEPKNPAVRVIVWKKGAPDDTSWAFLNMPPHYGRKSMLAFRLTRLEFENHAAIDAAKDTTAGGRSAGAKP